VITEWQQDALIRARGGGDPLDAHRFLATAKIAAALALLEMREDVNDEDWQLAQHVMRVSVTTRERVKRHLVELGELEWKSKGRVEGIRQVAAEEAADAARRKLVKERVLKLLGDAGGELPAGAIKRGVTGSKR